MLIQRKRPHVVKPAPRRRDWPHRVESGEHKSWAALPPTVENNLNYKQEVHTPAIHIFAVTVAPGDRRTSLFRQPKQRSQRFGSKLNCYQRGHGGNGTIKLYRRDKNGMLNKETDC